MAKQTRPIQLKDANPLDKFGISSTPEEGADSFADNFVTGSPLKVKKSHLLLAIIPQREFSISLRSRRLFNVLANQTQLQLPAFLEKTGYKTVESFPQSRIWNAKYTDLAKLLDLSPTNVHRDIFESMTELNKIRLSFFDPGDRKKSDVLTLDSLISCEMYTDEFGDRCLQWGWSITMNELICTPNQYVPINIEYINKFTHYASLALYEVCFRYRETNKYKAGTGKRPVEWWIKLLSTEDVKTFNWPLFKHRTLMPAIKEINELSDLEIVLNDKFYESESGRKITHAEFSSKLKKTNLTNPIDDSEELELSAELAAAGSTINVSPEKLLTIVERGVSEAAILDAIGKMAGRQVASPYAYLMTVLGLNNENVAQGPVTPTPAAPRPVMQVPAMNDELTVIKTTQELDHEASVTAIKSLPIAEQVALADRAINQLSLPVTASIKRSIATGDWHKFQRIKDTMVSLHQQSKGN